LILHYTGEQAGQLPEVEHVSEGFWDTEVVEETQAEEPAAPPVVAEQEKPAATVSVDEPVAVALSEDEFSALEERILRAVNLVKRERQLRVEADQRATAAEAQAAEISQRFSGLEQEITGLRQERGQVRQRVERLLEQLDTLEM
jgi:PHD/YefM family antitoxin component YafN of YafNO toxin-antitoxin module